EIERVGGQLGVRVQGYNVPAILRFAEKRQCEERVEGIPEERRGTSVDGLPFQVEETAKASQRLADVDGDILSLIGPVSPQRRDGDGLGGQTDRGHAAKTMGAGNDRIAAVEADFAAAVYRRHPDVLENVIGCGVQVDIRATFRIPELR